MIGGGAIRRRRWGWCGYLTTAAFGDVRLSNGGGRGRRGYRMALTAGQRRGARPCARPRHHETRPHHHEPQPAANPKPPFRKRGVGGIAPAYYPPECLLMQQTGVLDSGLRRNDGGRRRGWWCRAVWACWQAGVWIPAFAGMTVGMAGNDGGDGRNDGGDGGDGGMTVVWACCQAGVWIPAFAGMTVGIAGMTNWAAANEQPGVARPQRFSLTQPSPAGRGLSGAAPHPAIPHPQSAIRN